MIVQRKGPWTYGLAPQHYALATAPFGALDLRDPSDIGEDDVRTAMDAQGFRVRIQPIKPPVVEPPTVEPPAPPEVGPPKVGKGKIIAIAGASLLALIALTR